MVYSVPSYVLSHAGFAGLVIALDADLMTRLDDCSSPQTHKCLLLSVMTRRFCCGALHVVLAMLVGTLHGLMIHPVPHHLFLPPWREGDSSPSV
jgi:hypothetical protein